jgi:hypothetical protein
MNIIQMRERIMFHIDHVKSPRFDKTQYNNALNSAIVDFIEETYGGLNTSRRYSFQSAQKVRDKLNTLVYKTAPLTVGAGITAGKIITSVAPFPITTYRYSLMLECYFNGSTKPYYAKPISYDEYKEYKENKFLTPSLVEPYRVYWIEDYDGWIVDGGTGNVLTSAVLTYLKNPAVVDIGFLIQPGALTNAVPYIVSEESVTAVGGVSTSRLIGSEVTFTAGANTLTSGELAYGFTNCDLPTQAHDEICKRAAAILTGVVQDYNKTNMLNIESNKN